MKVRLRRCAAAFLAALLSLALCVPALASDGGAPVTILFTHDTHSHVLLSDDGNGPYGGYTRLATLLKEQREKAPGACITLDGGDFSMGSLYQTIFTTDASELRMLGAMGYDATTLGNHEFDYRAQGLADMLEAAASARASGETLPALVQANYKPADSDASSGAQAVRKAREDYGVPDYTVIEKDGVRFAVFGLMGVDADDCAPMSGMELEDPIDAAKRVVAEIRKNEDYDYLICLSHCGTDDTDPTGKKSEDYRLAKAVSGIDVILSGHTHSTLETPMQVGNTYIVSCGEYTKNLGVLRLSGKTGSAVLEGYELLPVTEDVPEDPDLSALAVQFAARVNTEYLSAYGYTFDQVLAESGVNFTPIGDFGKEQKEDALGNLITDSYIYGVQQAEGSAYVPVDFAVVAAGVVRGSFSKGDITVSDVFNVSSIGSGGDGTAGYPLVAVYVTGRELRDIFEVDASVTPLMPAAQLYGSGMSWSYNTRRLIFDKVTECHQILPDGSAAAIQNDKLYRLVTGLYSGQMLGSVNAKSFGILSVTPRDAEGNEIPISRLEEYIVHNPDGTEVKEWSALASYLKSLGTVSSPYDAPQGRKVVYASWNPASLLSHPRPVTLGVLGAAVVLIALVVLLLRRLFRRRGRSDTRGCRRYRGR